MMNKQTIVSLLLILTLFVITTTRVNGQRGRMVGTRKEIKDVKTNKEVQDLGKFSVEQYNNNLLATAPSSHDGSSGRGGANGRLVFLEVVEAERQVVAGLKYYLKVAAMQDGLSRTFDAVVVVKPWVKSKKLLNFDPAPSPSL